MKTALSYTLVAVVAIAAVTFLAKDLGAAINAPLTTVGQLLNGSK